MRDGAESFYFTPSVLKQRRSKSWERDKWVSEGIGKLVRD